MMHGRDEMATITDEERTTDPTGDNLTRTLARYAADLRFDDIPEEVRTVVRHCLLDWLGVTLAGSREGAGRIVREEAVDQGGAPQATLIGGGARTSVGQAALVNGTASHALDYDDVQFAFLGHPTVTVVPAILALAERDGCNGRDLITAFVAGVETGCRIGDYVTEDHYARGHHATGTLGAFAAAAGTSRLLGLDRETSATALGIAAAQAAGLKSMFGTMCKPLHAGKAAANGQYAALLAARGFTSRRYAVECSQGFADTQSSVADLQCALDGLGTKFHTRNVLFKYHAACYGTHASMEALTRLRDAHGIDAGNIDKVELRVPTRNLRVCNIQEPDSGLEAKFSLRMVSAMTLARRDTADIAGYDDELCSDAEMVRLRDKMQVVGTGNSPGVRARSSSPCRTASSIASSTTAACRTRTSTIRGAGWRPSSSPWLAPSSATTTHARWPSWCAGSMPSTGWTRSSRVADRRSGRGTVSGWIPGVPARSPAHS
jgi:2-methylcitrate dehydratase PrpD